MRDLILSFALLVVGFVALQKRATRDLYDYREELLQDSRKEDSLSFALEKALKNKHKNSASDKLEKK